MGVELPLQVVTELPLELTEEGALAGMDVYVRPQSAHCVSDISVFEVLVRATDKVVAVSLGRAALLAWAADRGTWTAQLVKKQLTCLDEEPRSFAGVALDRPRIMGIVNVTPDSFSDGGETPDTKSAIARGKAMLESGADILDIGGESTRPGAEPVSPEEEMRRVVPVVRALAAAGANVSIDTRRASVMEAALDAGAAIVNDVTALTGDSRSLAVVAASDAAVILMHMLGEPRTMQADPRYDCAPLDVYDHLADRIAACSAAGISHKRLAVDPGIGFGKTVAHNLQILGRLSLLRGLGCPVVLGVSRKSFIGRLDHDAPAQDRLAGSLAAGLAGLDQGAAILRVHDVAETRQAVSIWNAIHDHRDPA